MKVIRLNELSPATTTRSRGNSAFLQLRALLSKQPEPVELDLQSEVISTSFLDEIVRLLLEEGQLERVLFRVHQHEDLAKIATIAGLRNAKVRYVGLDTDLPKYATPRTPAKTRWDFDS